MEPEFPDPFLCQSLCREARTSPRLNAHTPAAGGKEEEESGGGGEEQYWSAVNNRIRLNSAQGYDKERGKAQHSSAKVHSSCAAMWVGYKSEPAFRVLPHGGTKACVAESSCHCAKLNHAAAFSW